MPNNDNNNENNLFDLPKEANNIETLNMDQPQNNNPAQQTPNIIEIPQSYYDKVAKEQQEKSQNEEKMRQEQIQIKENSSETQGLLFQACLNAIIVFGSIYLTVKQNLMLFLILPVAIIALSIFFAIKDKKKTTYPQSIMVGGIISAIISFILSMLNESSSDLYFYYSIASAIIGFIGYAVSSIFTKYINDFKSIKALETIGYLIFFGALIGVPWYFATNYHEEFFRIIFHTNVEVKAETEEEFVQKTIKSRYNIEYTCDSKKTKHYINEYSRRQIVREECKDSSGKIFSITSIAYNEGSNQYVVTDTYLDTILLESIKEEISTKIKNNISVNEVTVSLYPEENCFFYGDCVDCDEYYNRFSVENNIDNQYKISSTINFEDYLKTSPKKFLNDKKFKYILNVYGSFDDNTYQSALETIMKTMNDNEYKNNYGFIINLYNVIGSVNDYDNAYKRLAYKAVGEANDSNKFLTYKEESVSAGKKEKVN